MSFRYYLFFPEYMDKKTGEMIYKFTKEVVKERINQKYYVIGWDYAHYYNAGTTIEQVREDIEEVIETITEEKSK